MLSSRHAICIFPRRSAVVFENVIVRSGKGHDMEVHIDTDEANAIAMRGTPMMEVLP